MKIGIGCDHGGLELKDHVIEHLKLNGFDVEDFGTYSDESVDYPDCAVPVCKAVQNKKIDRGILICGTGIGISIAANKHKGIRAALCSDVYSAKMSRMHNNAQIVCMGGRVIGREKAFMIVDTFLNTDFEGGRHISRLQKISDIENNQ